ncbi:MAG: hypothetical protein ACTSQY_11330 [Candidatus Odinarchaeia archaeon]
MPAVYELVDDKHVLRRGFGPYTIDFSNAYNSKELPNSSKIRIEKKRVYFTTPGNTWTCLRFIVGKKTKFGRKLICGHHTIYWK